MTFPWNSYLVKAEKNIIFTEYYSYVLCILYVLVDLVLDSEHLFFKQNVFCKKIFIYFTLHEKRIIRVNPYFE